MKHLHLPLVLLLIASSVLAGYADGPAKPDASASGFTPDVAKFLPTIANPYQRSYEAGLPAIVQKNVASMHQIQSLSVDTVSYAAGTTPGTDKPEATGHVDWQQPDKAHIRQYRNGSLVSEQIADGTYRWQWSAGNPPFAAIAMKTDMRPANTPKGGVVAFSDLGGLYDPNVGMICRPDGLLFSGNLKDLGEITVPGAPTIHRISIVNGQRGVINPQTKQMEMVDAASVYDLDTTSGLPYQVTNSGASTILYSHYRINAALPNDTFTTQNPEQYTYAPSAALPLRPGSLAPDFALTNGDGKPVALSDLRGQTVLLCFTEPLFNAPTSVAGPLEDLSHYVDPSEVTVALVTDRPLKPEKDDHATGMAAAYQALLAAWVGQHPFLTKLCIVDNGKGFGEKIQERVLTRYGLSGESAVLIDKHGVVQTVYNTVYDTGQMRLQTLGKTEAGDAFLKGNATMDSALATQIEALSTK